MKFGLHGRARKNAVPRCREQRLGPRFLAIESRVWLGWWEGNRYVVCASRVVDISQSGALIEMAEGPVVGTPVWICLGVPEPSDAVEAEVIVAASSPQGGTLIRLAFFQPCPRDLLHTIAFGI